MAGALRPQDGPDSVAIPCRVARSGNEGESKDWGASETHDWDVAPPHAAPAWITTDLDELLDPEPAVVGDPSFAGNENDEVLVASYVELAMENRQHHQVRVEPDQENDPLYCFGSGDARLYAIRDGVKRLMIGRAVGRDGEGCIYCLVATSSPALLAMLDTGQVAPTEAFNDAAELALCSVYLADHTPRRHFRLSALNRPVSNVVLVQHYKRMQDVPLEYRPGQPFLQFAGE
jgi:hypothetical protein